MLSFEDPAANHSGGVNSCFVHVLIRACCHGARANYVGTVTLCSFAFFCYPRPGKAKGEASSHVGAVTICSFAFFCHPRPPRGQCIHQTQEKRQRLERGFSVQWRAYRGRSSQRPAGRVKHPFQNPKSSVGPETASCGTGTVVRVGRGCCFPARWLPPGTRREGALVAKRHA